MDKELLDELTKRGTAEVVDGKVVQITQALDEQPDKVKYTMFGELKENGIIPIAEACAKCNHKHFPTVEECQKVQKKDAEARGFHEVVCPKQFIEG
jgi:uncharacterized OB-fold protein